MDWITNAPEVAAKLHEADKEYEKSRKAAERLPLAEKIIALRNAKAKKQQYYNATIQQWSTDMTTHPTRSNNVRYYKICPRGFANEVRYVRVLTDEQAKILEDEYSNIADKAPGAWAHWTRDLEAQQEGVAVEFGDRNWL